MTDALDKDVQAEIERLTRREIPQLERDARDYERVKKQNVEKEKRNG